MEDITGHHYLDAARYSIGFDYGFHKDRTIYTIVYQGDFYTFTSKEDVENFIRSTHGWPVYKFDLSSQQNLTNMNKIPLKDVNITTDERQKIADELQLDIEAKRAARHIITNFFSHGDPVQNKRLLKMIKEVLKENMDESVKKSAERLKENQKNRAALNKL